MQRFAVIADVHGNRWALEAVLDDVAQRGIRDIVNAGDHLFGPLDVAGAADLLIGIGIPTVAGNQDRELVEKAPPPGMGLSAQHSGWLASLPARLELPGGILLFHGTPDRDDVYLLESVHASGRVFPASASEIVERIDSAKGSSLLLCGHTHIPRFVTITGQSIVNPGSVGLQAYADDSPVAHVMETGSPHARYAVVDRREIGWHVEHIAINYDFETAARYAEKNSRPDWAWRLRTGRAR